MVFYHKENHHKKCCMISAMLCCHRYAMFVVPNHKTMKTLIPILLVLSVLANELFSQDLPDSLQPVQNSGLNIYLDCGYCDFDYIRTSFSEVNYMNDRQDADVHILVNAVTNGSGGSQYDIIFKGQKKYASHCDTLVFHVPGNSTDEEVRAAMLENLQLGLVPYLVKTSAKSRMILLFDESPSIAEEKDPWKNWMFELSADGSYFYSRNATMLSLNGSLYISKINPKIKFESSTSFLYNDTEYRMYDEDEEDVVTDRIYDVERNLSSYNLWVRSLGEHAGIGLMGRYRKSIFSNYKNNIQAGPAVEYNLFKYSEASRKQCRIGYYLLYEHSDYNVITENHKTSENFVSNELRLTFSYYDTWGTLNSTLWASCYLNDFDQYDFGSYNTASINLAKGFSFYATFSFSVLQNQRNLPLEQASEQDLLTGRRVLESSFNYNVGIGIAYRFGSIFNNAVNPRFGY